jgi:hypothetical protein
MVHRELVIKISESIGLRLPRREKVSNLGKRGLVRIHSFLGRVTLRRSAHQQSREEISSECHTTEPSQMGGPAVMGKYVF